MFLYVKTSDVWMSRMESDVIRRLCVVLWSFPVSLFWQSGQTRVHVSSCEPPPFRTEPEASEDGQGYFYIKPRPS